MSAQRPDYYAVLGVSADSTFGAIQKAFFKLSLAHHPDRRDKSEFEEAHKEFVLISAAHNVLKDKESRRKYDETLRAHKTQRPSTVRSNSRKGNPWFHQGNDGESESEPYSERQRARRTDRGHSKQRETSSDPNDSGKHNPHKPYEIPRYEDDEQISPEEEAWLRFRNAKNNLQGLAFSLQDALCMVLEIIRSLRKVDDVKRQATAAREQLRFIETSFHTLQIEIDFVHSPILLAEATVSRVKKMIILEEHIRDLLGLLKPSTHPDDTGSPEEKAIATSKLVLKAMNTCVQLCK